MLSQGWKDVLRPIRDGLRDLFPSPDQGPTPAERLRQRRLHALDGFTYFDDFDQLAAWNPQDADPVQKANTPLLPRTRAPRESKSKVLLCHDMSGNYHAYESCQSRGVEQEEYHCEYLQFVDCFVYFSHKLVCVPPPLWTNSLHRNGVKVLGTLLVERQTRGLDRLLDKSRMETEEHYAFASLLAKVADVYGFDGWLVNIEKKFSIDAWELSSLLAFLRQLKRQMGEEKQLIWYDALTADNRVEYQNGLTEGNVPFAQACGSLLTNYSWTYEGASSSKGVATRHQIDTSCIYFGIDTWAQNSTHGLSKRVTYPEDGGGGTKTGIAVKDLSGLGFSTGIFAPAWTYEHFPGHGAAMERCMWEGDALSDDITCGCRSASQHPTNTDNPITSSACWYPAGSPTFFYTNFSRAFASHDPALNEIYRTKRLHAQLGSQSILP
ncbi:glycoside hydrolase family 85 protein, partial [Saccharata proteae CBS 121410]